MGIHGIYKEIGPGDRVALSKLAVDKFEETNRPLRIAIDVSIWLFQIQASKGGTNPALRTFYYRLLRLIALSIHPVFVFDGPDKPPFKRGKRTGPNVASVPEFLAKQLLKQFGFPIHLAPGEAEAECALLQREGIVDAVLSEDVDTLMFGSGITIRNWSPELKTSKTPTHVNVYDAVKTKRGSSGLDREGMILVALMSGGDYVPEGIPGCGPKTACEAARAGFGSDLCNIRKGDIAAIRIWRERLQHELKTNESKHFKRRHGTLLIPDDFPRTDILGYYTHPVVSNKAGLDKLRRSIRWDQEIDFPGLREFAHDAFDWVKLEGAKHFVRSLAPSLLVRALRKRAESDDFDSEDLVARQEHEAILVKGIHGRRQHLVTDNTLELRVSFTPIELVKIDLGAEDPDDDTEYAQEGNPIELDLDEEVALDLEDGESGPKKRGPTKFDPSKSARVWVAQTFVQMGVPLKFEDWRAGLDKSKKTTSARETAKGASKARGGRKTKRNDGTAHPTIDLFAKVTKPGLQRAKGPAKGQDSSQSRAATSQSAIFSQNTVIDLLSSSPAKPQSRPVIPPARQVSFSPVIEDLPPSVTKRRRRGPIQRSHTLPADLTADARPSTPPPTNLIETLDLLSSPAFPSPSELTPKRPKVHKTQRSPTSKPGARPPRQESVTSTPGKTRQTTLDVWSRTPTRTRKDTPPRQASPTPSLQHLALQDASIDTLDLTLSSPAKPLPMVRAPNPRGTGETTTASRPPLQSITSNASISSSTSSQKSSTSSKPARQTRRTSPRLQRQTSTFIDTLDLTDLCSSPLAPIPITSVPTPLPLFQPPNSNPIQDSGLGTPRRSPRTSKPPPLPATEPNKPLLPSPPSSRPAAAWKSQKQKKRVIQLRESLAGSWTFADAEPSAEKGKAIEDKTLGEVLVNGSESGVVLKGKERRVWRVSQVEELDLT